MANEELRRAVSKVKEQQQFGSAMTFADMMEAFHAAGDEIASLWPWVPFDSKGRLLCTIMPTPKAVGYELILVQALEAVRFPIDKKMGFRIANIEQHITVIEGSITVQMPCGDVVAGAGETINIDNNELVAYCYGPGVFLFKQVPHVAKEMDFSFDFLNK